MSKHIALLGLLALTACPPPPPIGPGHPTPIPSPVPEPTPRMDVPFQCTHCEAVFELKRPLDWEWTKKKGVWFITLAWEFLPNGRPNPEKPYLQVSLRGPVPILCEDNVGAPFPHFAPCNRKPDLKTEDPPKQICLGHEIHPKSSCGYIGLAGGFEADVTGGREDAEQAKCYHFMNWHHRVPTGPLLPGGVLRVRVWWDQNGVYLSSMEGWTATIRGRDGKHGPFTTGIYGFGDWMPAAPRPYMQYGARPEWTSSLGVKLVSWKELGPQHPLEGCKP